MNGQPNSPQPSHGSGKSTGAARREPPLPRANHECVRLAYRLSASAGRLSLPAPLPGVRRRSCTANGSFWASARTGRPESCQQTEYSSFDPCGLALRCGRFLLLCPLLFNGLGIATIGKQHGNDDGAVDDLPTPFGHLHDRQRRMEENDQDNTEQRAEIAVPARPGYSCLQRQPRRLPAADKHRAFLIGLGGIAGERDTGQSRREPLQHEGEHDDAASSDASRYAASGHTRPERNSLCCRVYPSSGRIGRLTFCRSIARSKPRR